MWNPGKIKYKTTLILPKESHWMFRHVPLDGLFLCKGFHLYLCVCVFCTLILHESFWHNYWGFLSFVSSCVLHTDIFMWLDSYILINLFVYKNLIHWFWEREMGLLSHWFLHSLVDSPPCPDPYGTTALAYRDDALTNWSTWPALDSTILKQALRLPQLHV